jgi:uncharacterized alkaline shock family protein YloU
MTEKNDNHIMEETDLGEVNISDEVIEIIANISVLEVEGVTGLSGNLTEDLAGIFSKKSHTKGVTVSVEEDTISIEINIIVRFGVKIPEVAWQVQENVKTAVESMTGKQIGHVNVNIAGINY